MGFECARPRPRQRLSQPPVATADARSSSVASRYGEYCTPYVANAAAFIHLPYKYERDFSPRLALPAATARRGKAACLPTTHARRLEHHRRPSAARASVPLPVPSAQYPCHAPVPASGYLTSTGLPNRHRQLAPAKPCLLSEPPSCCCRAAALLCSRSREVTRALTAGHRARTATGALGTTVSVRGMAARPGHPPWAPPLREGKAAGATGCRGGWDGMGRESNPIPLQQQLQHVRRAPWDRLSVLRLWPCRRRLLAWASGPRAY